MAQPPICCLIFSDCLPLGKHKHEQIVNIALQYIACCVAILTHFTPIHIADLGPWRELVDGNLKPNASRPTACSVKGQQKWKGLVYRRAVNHATHD